MSTITIDILNSEAMKMLQELENQKLIRMHKVKTENDDVINWAIKYKGAMTQQSTSDVDNQLNELRSEWE